MMTQFKNTLKFLGIFSLMSLLIACGGGENVDGSNITGSAAVQVNDTSSGSNNLANTDEDSASNTGSNPVANGSASLSWTPPTQNVDNSALSNLDSYKIYYGTEKGNYINIVTINNPGITEYIVENLTGNSTYYFVITALDSAGNESGFSNIVSKTI